jgi:UDP-N-acetylmuramyl pentapeptide phosphotransferase/UDP-N-acetylglucosamine-1-phosphate transferase
MSIWSASWPSLLATALLTAIGIELMRRWSARRLLDIPNERSSHTRPTPRGGGLPLIAVALGVWAFLMRGYGMAEFSPYMALVVGSVMVGIVSWLDDLKPLPFRTRLTVHLLAGALVLYTAAPPESVPLPGLGEVPLGVLAWPLALIWIAGLTNAYNFMDGIDGIAGGQGLVAGLAWLYFGISLAGGGPVAGLGLILAAGCATFLLFNWQPARIFMGDVGSATLGFIFAALPFVFDASGPIHHSSSWIAGVAVLWPFVFDSGFTLVRRWRRGEKLTEAHRSHLYQRLVIAGWTHAQVSLVYIFWAVTTTGAGFAMARGIQWSGIYGLLWASMSGLAIWGLTVRAEARRTERAA